MGTTAKREKISEAVAVTPEAACIVASSCWMFHFNRGNIIYIVFNASCWSPGIQFYVRQSSRDSAAGILRDDRLQDKMIFNLVRIVVIIDEVSLFFTRIFVFLLWYQLKMKPFTRSIGACVYKIWASNERIVKR